MDATAVPLNALDRHLARHGPALEQAAAQVIRSGYVILGPHVAAFEAAFARYCGCDHAVGVANGTDAIELGLRALGVTAGDEVALVANAAMYGTTALNAIGAKPVYVDVQADTACMDPAALQQALQAHPRIRAVIVTHLYGRLADMAAIGELCAHADVAVFEDCAQAHGARDADGRRAGSFGAAASFSFYPTKNLGAIGDGGMVTTSDDAVATRLKQLRQYGWSAKYSNSVAGGRNSRLDEIQAAMLQCLLPHLDSWNARRQAIAARYRSELKHTQISPLAQAPAGADVAHLFVVRSERRDALRAHLDRHGIGNDVHYPIADHRQAVMREACADTRLPVTEALCDSMLTLPCFPELTDEEVGRVIDACNSF